MSEHPPGWGAGIALRSVGYQTDTSVEKDNKNPKRWRTSSRLELDQTRLQLKTPRISHCGVQQRICDAVGQKALNLELFTSKLELGSLVSTRQNWFIRRGGGETYGDAELDARGRNPTKLEPLFDGNYRSFAAEFIPSAHLHPLMFVSFNHFIKLQLFDRQSELLEFI